MENNNTLVQHLGHFLIQATSGPFIALIRSGIKDININMITFLYIKYLNDCWHSYGKKNDQFVVQIFDAILNFEKIKGIVCLMHWLKTIGIQMIEAFDLEKNLDKLKDLDIDQKRIIIHDNMETIFSKFVPFVNNVKCQGDNCDNEYDGNNIFYFK